MKFVDWYAEFVQGKREIECETAAPEHGIHEIRRFERLDAGEFWDIGRTYTGRLVLRAGTPSADGVISWQPWQTLHEVELLEEAPPVAGD